MTKKWKYLFMLLTVLLSACSTNPDNVINQVAEVGNQVWTTTMTLVTIILASPALLLAGFIMIKYWQMIWSRGFFVGFFIMIGFLLTLGFVGKAAMWGTGQLFGSLDEGGAEYWDNQGKTADAAYQIVFEPESWNKIDALKAEEGSGEVYDIDPDPDTPGPDDGPVVTTKLASPDQWSNCLAEYLETVGIDDAMTMGQVRPGGSSYSDWIPEDPGEDIPVGMITVLVHRPGWWNDRSNNWYGKNFGEIIFPRGLGRFEVDLDTTQKWQSEGTRAMAHQYAGGDLNTEVYLLSGTGKWPDTCVVETMTSSPAVEEEVPEAKTQTQTPSSSGGDVQNCTWSPGDGELKAFAQAAGDGCWVGAKELFDPGNPGALQAAWEKSNQNSFNVEMPEGCICP
ncbi:hypothetical protein KKE34_01970 [Patescibacteria group bacterium]|nr:hypothetical protein [Patescibacteria group bacterium]MBU1885352.1 hypothetical protein [Patescibacteria group bacterium]